MIYLLFQLFSFLFAPCATSSAGDGKFNYTCSDGSVIETWNFDERCDGFKACPDASDELDCDRDECLNSTSPTFHCQSTNRCLSLWFDRCNGVNDCGDSQGPGEDEENCKCETWQWQCSSGQCVGTSQARCNGHIECVDGSDEKGCTKCSGSHFHCLADLSCIDRNKVLNGLNDCSNGADEAIGNKLKPETYEWTCGNGQVIYLGHRCDGHDQFHCFDKSDERNCSECAENAGHFCETDRKCLSLHEVCDGNADCSDASDEENCDKRTCHDWEFNCGHGHCISRTMVCDGTAQCADGVDEKFCSKQ